MWMLQTGTAVAFRKVKIYNILVGYFGVSLTFHQPVIIIQIKHDVKEFKSIKCVMC